MFVIFYTIHSTGKNINKERLAIEYSTRQKIDGSQAW